MESCKLQDVTRKLELKDKPMEIWKMSSTYIKHTKVYFTRKRFTKSYHMHAACYISNVTYATFNILHIIYATKHACNMRI